jgi:hypothetical protein
MTSRLSTRLLALPREDHAKAVSANSRSSLRLPLLVSLLIGLPWFAVASASNPVAADFPAIELNIFSADGKRIIGHGRYTISPTDDTELLRGESNYLDGEHDLELETLKFADGSQAPTLLNYEHSFFSPDQTLQRVSGLDARNGTASCKTYVNGQLQDRQANLDVPADTYAGATQMMFVVIRLRQGADDIEFHSFNCMPGPKIVPAQALVRARRVKWGMHSGQLVQLEIQPNFGWLDFLLAPFMPKMWAWVDPDDNWNYVGGLYDRFYKGPRILAVRASPPADQR